MTRCEMCGIDLDIEGWFTMHEHDMEFTWELCGHCKDKVKKFIEMGN